MARIARCRWRDRRLACLPTDADGSRPDWGPDDVDYLQFPAPLLQALLDASEVQTEWLRLLAGRTERLRNSVLAGTMGESEQSGLSIP